jgi:putative hydrolase of the HAD superfamily
VVVSAAVNRRKPNPEIFQTALEWLQLDAAEAVFVGDTVDADVLGPKAVGMRTVYVERRLQEDVEVACPTQRIKSLGEVVSAVERC